MFGLRLEKAPSEPVGFPRMFDGKGVWMDNLKAVAIHVYGDIRDHNAMLVAAGVAFYAVLALLPALTMLLALYGIFVELEEAERQIDGLLGVLPGSAMRLIDTQLRASAAANHATLSIGFGVSLLILGWTVSNATRAIVRAVKLAYDQELQRSKLEQRGIALLLSFGMILALVVSLAVVAAVPVFLTRFDPTHHLVTFGNVRWIFVAGAMVAGSGILYRYAPPDRPRSWREVLPGASFSMAVWTVASIGFSVYVSSFGSYDETHGSLGTSVVLLLWFWLSALAIIVGAEVNQGIAIKRAELAQ